MDGSQSIDPQMIRDHDVDMKALHAAIRDIEAEAWKQQDRLRLAHPQVEGRHRRWRRDRPSSHDPAPQVINDPERDAQFVAMLHHPAPQVIPGLEVESLDRGTRPSPNALGSSRAETSKTDTGVGPDVNRILEVEALLAQARSQPRKPGRLSQWLRRG